VGIADIGAAAGVSGSAIYRHFASKQEILVALLDSVVDGLLAGARRAVDEHQDARDALDELVRAHVAFALRDRAIIRVYDQEEYHLPEADRARIRATQRGYAAVWTDTLQAVNASLAREVARTRVHAAFGLLNSVADFTPELGDAELAHQLHTMTMAGLLAPAGVAQTLRR
jgi:AcrR family transcriptional regulator